MSNTLADAYVRIRPDARGFETDLVEKARQAGSAAGNAAGGAAGNRINERLRALNLPNIDLKADPRQALLEIDRVKAKLEEISRKSATASLRVDAKAGIAEMDKFKALLQLKGREAGRAGGEEATKGFKNGFDRGSSVFSTVAGIMASKLALIGAAAATATPSIVNLAASLIPVTGALVAAPALLTGAAAAFGVLKLATAGFGKALHDGLTGNWKAFAKDLKDMPPAEQAAARAIVGLKGRFDELRKSVAGNFWGPITSQLGGLVHNLLPVLEGQLPRIASSMGNFGREILKAAQGGTFLRGLNDVLGATAQGIQNASGGAGKLVQAFGVLLSAGAPIISQLGTGFTTLSTKFLNFINNAQRTGQLTSWLKQAVGVLDELWHLVQNVGSVFASVFKASQATGQNLLVTITNLTSKIAAFLKSAEGSQALVTVFRTINSIGGSLGTVLVPVLKALADSLKTAGPALQQLAPIAAQFIIALTPLLPLFTGITATLLKQLMPVLLVLANWLRANPQFVKLLSLAIAGVVVGIKAWELATKALAAINVALNIVLRANPIILIITLIAALVIGVIYAYNHFAWFRTVVQGAWTGIRVAAQVVTAFFLSYIWPTLHNIITSIGNVAMWLWHNAIEPAWLGIRLAFTIGAHIIGTIMGAVNGVIRIVAGVMLWFQHNIVEPVWHGIAIVIQANAHVIGNIFGAINAVIRIVADVFLWFFHNVIVPVWNGVAHTIQVASHVIGEIFGAINAIIRIMAGVFNWLLHNIIIPVWNGIGNTIKTASHVIGDIFGAINAGIRAVGGVFNWLLHTIVIPVWNGIGNTIKTVAHVIGDILDALIHVVKDLVPQAFREAKDAIGKAWHEIMAFVHDPVAFVINTVYMKGVKPVWDFVASKVGLKPLEPMTFKASGGYISGPGGPTSDSIPAMLSNGEYVVNAAKTKEYLPVLEAINSGHTGIGDIGVPFFPHNAPSDIMRYCVGGMCDTADWKKKAQSKYALGGVVIPVEFAAGGKADAAAVIARTQAWLRQQAGKPYVMGAAGPGAWDCSGLVGGALKMINGQNPNGRLFDTSNEGNFFQGGFGGVDDLNVGFVGGSGGSGHTVGSIGGLNFEATPPRVLIGNVHMTPGNSYFKNKGHAPVGGGIKFSGGGGGGFCLPNPVHALVMALFNRLLANPVKGWTENELKGETGWKPEARGGVNKFIEGIRAKIDELIPEKICIGGGGGGGGGSAEGGKHWESVIKQALQMLGLPMSWVGPVETLISRESGGNPRAQNNSDSNAQRGDPSRGLMQTIGATFSRFHVPGHDDIFAPLDNILAGLRYIKATYGDIHNVQQAVGSSPRGYDNGGPLPVGWSTIYNGTGKPENVITHDKMIDMLDKMDTLIEATRGVGGDLGKAMGGVGTQLKTVGRLK